MKITDPERRTRACQIYTALLRLYPNSFQHEYGGTLAQHFRDEYRDALALSGQFSVLRFWIFILFDFICSLLTEHQEEVVKMGKKYFFVCCAVAAGLVTLLQLPSIYQWFFHSDKLDMWSQLLFWPLFFGSSALTLLGVAKVTRSHLIFRIFALLVLVSAISSLPIPIRVPVHGWVGRPAFSYLYANEDRLMGYFTTANLLLMGTISIVAFIKKKWLPGVCLLAMNLSMLIPNVAYTNSEDSLILENTWNSNWYPVFLVSLFVIAWFMIAWWLKKESVPAQVVELV